MVIDKLWILLIIPLTVCYKMVQVDKVFKGDGLAGDWGDYNHDGLLDLISYDVDDDKKVSTIYIYTGISKKLDDTLYYKINVNGIIVGLVATDLNSDNYLDVLLIMKNENDTTRSVLNKSNLSTYGYYLLGLFRSNGELILESNWDSRDDIKNINNNHMLNNYKYTSIHPLIADINGDGQIDILCQTLDNHIFVWIANNGEFYPYLLKDIPDCIFIGEISGYIPSPHSCAFVDMDGDCRADLIFIINNLDKKYIELWLSSYNNTKLVYTRENFIITLPNYYGQLLFYDFNGDGNIDIAIPYCNNIDNNGNCLDDIKITFSFNKQIPFCTKLWQKQLFHDCRHPTNMCISSPMEFNNPIDKNSTLITFKDYKFIGNYKNPITLYTADFNNNGYTDITIATTSNNKEFIHIFKNIERTDKTIKFSNPIEIPIKFYSNNEHIYKVTGIDVFEDVCLSLQQDLSTHGYNIYSTRLHLRSNPIHLGYNLAFSCRELFYLLPRKR